MNIRVNDQIELCPIALEHAETLFAILDSHRKFYHQFLLWPDMPTDVAGMSKFIEQKIAGLEQQTCCYFTIKFQDVIIGVGGFHQLDIKEKVGSIGCWIDSKYNSKAIPKRSAIPVVEYGFKTYDLERIEIKCTADNYPSKAIAERLGFTFVDTQEKAAKIGGRLQDIVTYTIVKGQKLNSVD